MFKDDWRQLKMTKHIFGLITTLSIIHFDEFNNLWQGDNVFAFVCVHFLLVNRIMPTFSNDFLNDNYRNRSAICVYHYQILLRLDRDNFMQLCYAVTTERAARCPVAWLETGSDYKYATWPVYLYVLSLGLLVIWQAEWTCEKIVARRVARRAVRSSMLVLTNDDGDGGDC